MQPKIYVIPSSSSTYAEESAKFERAMSETKFGKFNYCFLILIIPGTWSMVFENTSISYVFPIAHCDLNLSLREKGLLNASAYIGMIAGGFLWGFLCDVLGRKKILLVTYFSDAAMVILSGFSQNFTTLFTFKFFGGFFVTGVFVGLASYFSEFYSAAYRAKAQMFRGSIISLGIIVMPLLGLVVFPNYIHIDGSWFLLHSWNIYLFICAVPALLGGIILLFFPESPKFLMMVGRNKEALKVFQLMYSVNTGNKKKDYPIKQLVDETAESHEHGGHVTPNRTTRQALLEGCQQIKPICFPPYLKYVVLISCIQVLNMLSMHTLRLWFPQLFQSFSDYKYHHNGTADFCTMITMVSPQISETKQCLVNVSADVYINTIIIACTSATVSFIVVLFINKVRKTLLLVCSCLLSGICASTIYFSTNVATVVALASLFQAFGVISFNTILIIIVDLFPTTQRSFTISTVMTMARLSTMLGNVVFPYLLEVGCSPPFLFIGSSLIVSSFLAAFIPNTDLKPLE